jgi:Tol biopolymer transport system component
LKPENLMVSKDGYVKILDFGLSKLVAPESGELSAMPTLARPETHPGTVLGTVAYMSPEQASGEAVDFRSDQFSLGSILYEVVTGEKAFSRKTAAETMSAIIREEPVPLAKLRPAVPLPLRWIVERCFAKDPEERYASTRDLARDLAAVRDHISEISSGAEAVVAAPVRAGKRLVLLLAAAGLTLALLVGWIAHGALREAPASVPSFHRLTFRHGLIGNARFAPDGQTIVYGALWDGDLKLRIYLTRVGSPESQAFDFPDADILAISSSGEMAVWLEQFNRAALARVPMTGGVPRDVLEGMGYANADWAPDGKELVVVRQVEGQYRLEYPIGKVLFASPGVHRPRFSRSGDRIAFFDRGSLSVVDRSGKAMMTLSGDWSSLEGVPCWTPDGKEIWFTTSKAGEADALNAVNLSGKRRLVLRMPGSLELDDISRDGRVLLNHSGSVGVLMGRLSGEERERDLSWLDASVPADLSADGKTLVFTEAGEGGGAISSVYLRPTDGSPPVKLGEGSGLALSPDGKWVLASAPAGLVLLPTKAGETKTLKDDRFVSYGGAAWFPDGKRIVFAARGTSGQWRIYVRDLEGGESRPVSPEGFTIQPGVKPLSPDGKLVVGAQGPGKASIFSVDGGNPRPVAGLEAGDALFQWSEDGRALYVRKWRDDYPKKRVWLLDPVTGQRRIWMEIKPEEFIRATWRLLLTRDGKSYVYGSQRILSALYLIEGLK